jgi:hypothetical protein
MSLDSHAFKNFIFKRCCLNWWKRKTNIYYTKISKMEYCNNMFWFMDVSRCTWHFKGWLTTKACHYWFVWINKSYYSSLSKKFDIIVGWIWVEEESLAYVHDEGSNLNVMTTTLKSIVSCECLGLKENFQRFLFWPCFL